MLTGVAARLNEVKQRQNFSVKHFLGVAACGFRQAWNSLVPCHGQWRGHSGGLAILVYVTRLGDVSGNLHGIIGYLDF